MQTGTILAFEGTGQPLAVQRHPVPFAGPGEIIVANSYTTICGSDLHTWCGKRTETCPTVLGHEIVGRVTALGAGHSGLDAAGERLQPGDLVTWTVFASDPDSSQSKLGMPQKGAGLFKYGHALVEDGNAFHGGLGEYCVLKPGTAILRLPQDFPLEIAATINCAVSTVAGAIRLAGDVASKRVLISGMGLLGIVCAAMCSAAGAANVIAADLEPERLQMASQFGATTVVNFRTNDPVPDADIAFDMSGAPEAMEAGLDALQLGGIAVWVGAVFKTRAIKVNPETMIRKLLTIRGLHNYNYEDFRTARDFMVEHLDEFPFHLIVEKEFALADADAAFEYAMEHKPLRVGVRI